MRTVLATGTSARIVAHLCFTAALKTTGVQCIHIQKMKFGTPNRKMAKPQFPMQDSFVLTPIIPDHPPIVSMNHPVVSKSPLKSMQAQSQSQSTVQAQPPQAQDNPQSQTSVDKTSLEFEIINALTEAEKVSGMKLNFPKLVSIGNQSSGKSSVLEAITGVELFPKGSFMVTKRPLHLTLQRTETGKWAEFEDGVKMYNFSEIQARIERENQLVGGGGISDIPLRVKICSPEVYDLSVTDLPGYISVVKNGEDKNIPKRIRELCKPYVTDPNTIPLVVTSATEDPANCKGLQEVFKQSAQERSFGVVTKMDLPKNLEATVELLNNTMYPLKFGFFGVVLRGQDAIKNGVSIEGQFTRETQLFTKRGLDVNKLNLGVPMLRKTLSETLLSQIAPQLPRVIKELDTIIEKMQLSKNFLAKLAEESDLDTISKDLAIIVKRLHTESSYRTSFEKGFRTGLYEEIKKLVDKEFREKFKILPKTEMKEDEETTTVTKVEDKEHPYEDQIGSERIGSTEGYGNILHDRYTSYKKMLDPDFDLDRLKRMFIFGENSPEKISDRILHNLKDKFTESATLLSFFTLRLPDDRNVSRVEWTDNLNRVINSLIDPASPTNLQLLSFNLIMKDLFTFIGNIQIDGSNSTKTELAREFGKYLFEKIGKQIYGKDLSSAIYHHMNTEKRPDPDFAMIGLELARVTKTPKKFWSFFSKVKRNDIEVFGDEWTEAYINCLTRRITDNLFKSIGVNLLDPLIEEAIRYTLQTFRGDHVAEEAEQKMLQINALKKHRNTLQKAVDAYFISPPIKSESSTSTNDSLRSENEGSVRRRQ